MTYYILSMIIYFYGKDGEPSAQIDIKQIAEYATQEECYKDELKANALMKETYKEYRFMCLPKR